MVVLIDSISRGVTAPLTELTTLGRTLNKARRGRPGVLRPHRHRNGPTEAIDGRQEHLRGSSLGFRILTDYIPKAYSGPGASDRPHRRSRSGRLPAGSRSWWISADVAQRLALWQRSFAAGPLAADVDLTTARAG